VAVYEILFERYPKEISEFLLLAKKFHRTEGARRLNKKNVKKIKKQAAKEVQEWRELNDEYESEDESESDQHDSEEYDN